MKKQLNTAIAALFLATASMTTMAVEVGGTYVTAGMMKISTDEFDTLKTISGLTIDDKDTAATFSVGYQFDKNISLEAGVISAHDVGVSATTTGKSTGTWDGKAYSIPTATTFSLKTKLDTGYTLGTKFSSAVNDSFDIYGKVGMYFWDASAVLSANTVVRYDNINYAAGTEATLVTDSGSDVYYGIGGSYKVAPTVSIYADYLKLKLDSTKGDGVALGVSVDF